LWKLALDNLQVSLSHGNFTAYFKQTKLVALTPVGEERQIAEIACKSGFHQKILETRYYAQIKEALDSISKKNTELRFVVGTNMGGTTSGADPLFSQIKRVNITDLQVAQQRVGLNEDLNFDTFAVSTSNEMAHAAAVAVSKNMGGAYNPLFLYGGVGVGKTHLMQAIANSALFSNPTWPLVFCSGEEFTNDIIDAIQQKRTSQFKKRYRGAKGLFIDDVQFIAGKTAVQEEFFHTFNALVGSGGQVIMTSDQPPHDISNLEARLRSRFEGGLLVDIGEPNFELRSAILLIKAKQRKISLPTEAAQAVAANVTSTRKLEGILVRLATESKTRGIPIDVEMVQSILNSKILPAKNLSDIIKPLEVVKTVADYFHLTLKDIRGGRRSRPIVVPRHLAMYLLRIELKLPLAEIGDLFGNRDHTTVMHAVDKIGHDLVDSDSLRSDLDNLKRRMV